MKIEEAIKYLQNNLNEWKEKRPAYGNSEIVEEVDNDYNAIETLLTAYEKEKEKNKELQNRVDYLSRISGLLSTDTIIEEE